MLVTDLSYQDPLTGVFNRRYLGHLFGPGWADLCAAGPVSLLLLDLDAFKEVNDRHGHLAGDEVLRAIGALLRDHLRPEDHVVRYGGDEFVLLLPSVGRPEAEATATRLRALAAPPLPSGSRLLATTTPAVDFSVGIATCPDDGDQGEALLAIADRRLYEEKRRRQRQRERARRTRRALAGGLLAATLVVVGGRLWRAGPLTVEPPPRVAAAAPAEPSATPPQESAWEAAMQQQIGNLEAEVTRLRTALARTQPGPTPDQVLEDLEHTINQLHWELEHPPRPATATPPPPPPGPAPVAIATATPPSGDPIAAGAVPPILEKFPLPAYPRMARELRREATVQVRVLVDERGRVVEAEPIGKEAGYGFDEAARRAALAARYQPARQRGEPVAMPTTLTVRFVLP